MSKSRTNFRLIFAFIIASLFSRVYSATMLDVVDTPTAYTLMKGEFNVSIWGYNNGGLLTRATVGLHDNIYLGASFDIENLIGEDEAKFNIPGVIARVKLTDGWESFPLLIALGYDAFYSVGAQETNPGENVNSRLIFGPYFVITKPMYFWEQEQHFSLGVRLPVQPVYAPEDTSLFISIDVPIGQFVPMFEIEKIFFNGNRFSETLFNVGFRFYLYENFAIEMNFMLNVDQPANRILTFDYIGNF